MASTDRRDAARNAIRSLARTFNLPDDLHVLFERWNTVARLGDSVVIAKAATLAPLSRIDPAHWFAQEVRVCRELGLVGAPVQQPWGETAYHEVDGIPITLWHEIDGEIAGSTEIEMVDSLAALHRHGQSIELDQPWFATITVEIPGSITMLIDRQTLDPMTAQVFSDYLNRLLVRIDRANLPGGFVHGDAQRKNSILAAEGTIWIDLEETCRGPYAWDLACLTMNPMFDVDGVLDRYAEVSGTDRIETQHLGVLKGIRDLESLVWMLAIQDERDQQFRDDALDQFALVMNSASGG